MSLTGKSVLMQAGWWIIAALFAATVGASVYGAYQHQKVKTVTAEKATIVGERDQAVQINTSNAAEMTRVTKVNKELADTVRANETAAKAAGDRISRLTLERDAALAQSAAERRKLGRAHPEVATYNAGVMPLPLFCSLWPEAADCKNAGK